MSCCLVKQWLLTGNQDWRQLLLDGIDSRDKQFLAGYLCASLYHLIKDPQSRQIIFADHEAQAAVLAALLGAAHNTDTLVGPASPTCLVRISTLLYSKCIENIGCPCIHCSMRILAFVSMLNETVYCSLQ